jgi:hypothetical protein
MKVPRQCPLVLLVKVDWTGGKAVGSGECRDEKWCKERSYAHRNTISTLSVYRKEKKLVSMTTISRLILFK